MRVSRLHILLIGFALSLCAIPFRAALRRPVASVVRVARGRKTGADRIAQYGAAVRERRAPDFDRIGVAYPPTRLVLVGLKLER